MIRLCITCWLGAVCVLGMLLPLQAKAERVLLIANPHATDRQSLMLEFAIAKRIVEEPDLELIGDAWGLGTAYHTRDLVQQTETLRTKGKTYFDRLELEASIEQYERVLSLMVRHAPFLLNMQGLKDTLLMLSANHLLLGQDRRAKQYLDQLLSIDPTIRPDESVFNPSMMMAFQSALRKSKSARMNNVIVVARPGKTAVLVDGKWVGMGPVLKLSRVRRGRHYFAAFGKGLGSLAERADTMPGSRIVLKLHGLEETQEDIREKVLQTAAAAALQSPELSIEAATLAKDVEADSLLIFGMRGKTAYLVHYRADGSGRWISNAGAEGLDPAAAMDAASILLAPMIPATSPADQQATDDDKAVALQKDMSDTAESQDLPLGTEREEELQEPSFGSDDSFFLFSPYAPKEYALYGAYGSAAGLAIAGAVFGSMAWKDKTNYYKANRLSSGEYDHAATTDQIEGNSIKDSAKRNAMLADVSFGLAAAMAVAGVCMHVLWEPESAGSPVHVAGPKDHPVAFYVGPGGFSVAF